MGDKSYFAIQLEIFKAMRRGALSGKWDCVSIKECEGRSLVYLETEGESIFLGTAEERLAYQNAIDEFNKEMAEHFDLKISGLSLKE